jgi:hypothetical protein
VLSSNRDLFINGALCTELTHCPRTLCWLLCSVSGVSQAILVRKELQWGKDDTSREKSAATTATAASAATAAAAAAATAVVLLWLLHWLLFRIRCLLPHWWSRSSANAADTNVATTAASTAAVAAAAAVFLPLHRRPRRHWRSRRARARVNGWVVRLLQMRWKDEKEVGGLYGRPGRVGGEKRNAREEGRKRHLEKKGVTSREK